MKNYLILILLLLIQRSNAQIPTVQDCMGAIQIYDSVVSVPQSFSGTGNFPNEINGSLSCLNQGEKNDVWLYLDVCNNGSFGFSIIPNVLTDDYDWAVYDLTNATCSDIFTNYLLEFSCNFSGLPGITGPNGLSGGQNDPLLSVVTGQHLLINVSNFTSTQGGFEIHFINPNIKCNGGLIQGKVFRDLDSNCLQVNGENSLKKKLVQINPGNGFGFTDLGGNYNFHVVPGTYNVSIVQPLYSNLNCPPLNNYSVAILSTADSSLNNDFALAAPDSVFDLKCTLGASGTIRINATRTVYLDVVNNGTSPQGAVVKFKFDSLVNFISSSLPVDSIVNQDIWWHLDSVPVSESQQIAIELFCPANVAVGTDLEFIGNVIPANADTFPYDNADTISITTVYSYDPNEMVVSPVGTGAQHLIYPNQKLTYTIGFQNTGTDSAHNIMIDNPIDLNLDLSTIDLISSSHNYEIKLLNNNILRFNFYNINLPDSTNNEPGSHGFVSYSIYAKQNVLIGAVIHNSAVITFDLNAPLVTNSVFNTIGNTTSIHENSNSDMISVFPNPASDKISLSFSDEYPGLVTLELFDISGRKVLVKKAAFKNKMELYTTDFKSGVYELKITSGTSTFIKRIVLIKTP